MTNLDAQAAFITKAQTACRKARESGRFADLSAAAAILDSDECKGLPVGVQIDLGAAYGAAMVKCTGALA